MIAEGPRALVVDDDEQIREILRRLLASAGARVVAEVSSGEDALAWMSVNEAELVIMDIHMPGMGGVQATREIKAAKPGVTVFGFTGWGTADAEALLQAGASAVFEKTKLPALLEAIETTFRPRGEAAP